MPQIITQLAVTLFFGFTVFLTIWAVFRFPLPEEAPLHRRIAVAMGRGERHTVFEAPLLAPIMNLSLMCARRLNLHTVRRRTRQYLDGSGNPNGYSTEEYLAIALAFAVLFAALTALVGSTLLGRFSLLASSAMGMAGFIIPLWSLKGEADKRVRLIARQLPYTLDLVALMMGAGSTFTEALQTVIREDPEDPLNQELRIVLAEVEFGTKRADAMVYRSGSGGHVLIYEKGDVWGSAWTYEARGCSYGVVHNLRSVSSSYRARRRSGI